MKNKVTNLLAKTAGVLALVLTLGTLAEASPILRITTTGGGFALIQDNLLGDLDPTVGVIQFSGAIGTGPNRWTANLTIATSYPTFGSINYPHMVIDSLNVSNNAFGKMLIEFTEFFNVDAPIVLRGDFAGTTGGTIDYNLYADTTAFGTQTHVFGGQVAPVPGLYSGQFLNAGFDPNTLSGWTSAQNVYLTQTVWIQHMQGSQQEVSDGNFVAQVPEPTTLLLLGSGLIGLGLVRRRNN